MAVDSVISVAEWYVSEGGHDRASREQFEHAAAKLLGRKTYESLAGYWPSEAGRWADLLNPMPKYVASRTPSGSLDWNASVIDGDLERGVAKLKTRTTAICSSSAAVSWRGICSLRASSTS